MINTSETFWSQPSLSVSFHFDPFMVIDIKTFCWLFLAKGMYMAKISRSMKSILITSFWSNYGFLVGLGFLLTVSPLGKDQVNICTMLGILERVDFK